MMMTRDCETERFSQAFLVFKENTDFFRETPLHFFPARHTFSKILSNYTRPE